MRFEAFWMHFAQIYSPQLWYSERTKPFNLRNPCLLSVVFAELEVYVDGLCGTQTKLNKTLTRVSLAYNGLSDNGAAALGRCARLNKTLRELDVSNNRISANGARVFATGLKKNTCLEVLRVRLCLFLWMRSLITS